MSGKTVFLASLFRRLAILRPDTGFYVELSPERSTRLNKVYQQISNPGGWPDPTRRSEISEWEFTCSVLTARNETFSPFSIKYLDYSGEVLTEPDGRVEAADRVISRIEESEFLLVLLDGVNILRFLDGDHQLVDDLVPIFNLMLKSWAIVHFVITKWDVLARAGHTVQEVRDRLLQHPDFKDGVQTQLFNPRGTKGVRFIPVSSVGLDFAVLGPDGQEMVKKGNFPAPLHVEVPFMAVLVDLFEAELKRMAQHGSPEKQLIAQRNQRLSWVRMISDRMPLIRAYLRMPAAKSPLMRLVRDQMADVFINYVEDRAKAYGDKIEEDVARLRNRMPAATSEKEALNGLVALFHAKLAEFEAEHPGSRFIEGESSWTTV
ncbi:hypothetical protein AB0D66_18410 [Streptomyces sp. NPDC048270]|uniref:hypothetical protein n=1 Tax=Streptomyces sp. NPDC048270 TaxID=3154615 RepID=UPI0033FF7BD1